MQMSLPNLAVGSSKTLFINFKEAAHAASHLQTGFCTASFLAEFSIVLCDIEQSAVFFFQFAK
jgi:hypothetical protein